MSRNPDPSHQRNRRRRLFVFTTIPLVAAFCLGAIISNADARFGGPGVANKFAGVSHVSWNGLELNLWHVPGLGLYAYKITAPASLASGWRYCEPGDGYTKTVEQCVGAFWSSASAPSANPAR
jgi:hypothetical protein